MDALLCLLELIDLKMVHALHQLSEGPAYTQDIRATIAANLAIDVHVEGPVGRLAAARRRLTGVTGVASVLVLHGYNLAKQEDSLSAGLNSTLTLLWESRMNGLSHITKIQRASTDWREWVSSTLK